MKDVKIRLLLASAIIPVGVLIAFLILQDQRQGWPFEPHSEKSPPAISTSAAASNGKMPATARVPVSLAATQAEMLGLRFESAEVRVFGGSVPGVATVVADESRVEHVHTRVAGWLERMYVNTTGAYVRAGQPLGGVFSQELYSSQLEYLSSLRRAASGPASVVVEAGRTRLKLLGMSEGEIANLEATGKVHRLVTITAPSSGFVLERGVSEGTAVDPSTEILSLIDLSRVWVIAEVSEADASLIHKGTKAILTFPLSGLPPFTANVELVYPTLTERTRSVRVRMTVPNQDGLLRPGIYGSASFSIAARDALTVGRDAVVDTGSSQHVFVQASKNDFEPRQVKVGTRFGDRIEILEGLEPGEKVVSAGVFLIDSESRLRASGGTGHGSHGSSPKTAAPVKVQAERTEQPALHEHQP